MLDTRCSMLDAKDSYENLISSIQYPTSNYSAYARNAEQSTPALY
jgi:hypothetical protein